MSRFAEYFFLGVKDSEIDLHVRILLLRINLFRDMAG